MRETGSGHILSSGIKEYESQTSGDKYYGLVKARIDEVIFIDDTKNTSFKLWGFNAVQYHCTIVGSSLDGSKVKNIISACDLGGQYNYSETILTPVENQAKTMLTKDKDPSLTNGDFVLVLFLYGYLKSGIILTGFPQPLNKKYGAKKLNGRRKIWEFNGIEFNIDNKSNLRLRTVGRKDSKGQILNQKGIGTELIIYENGDLQLNLKGQTGDDITQTSSDATKDFRIKFTKETKKAEFFINNNEITIDEKGILVKDKNNNIVTLDDKGVKIQDKNNNIVTLDTNGVKVQDKNNNIVEMKSGAVNITVNGDAKIDASGKVDVKSGGNTKIESGGNADIKASGPVTVETTGNITLKSPTNAFAGGVVTANAINVDPITGIPLTPVGGVMASS